jgi:hypothetical protein
VNAEEQSTMSDESILLELNDQYLKAYMMADVGWYARQLTEDFVCRKSDGSVLEKQEFLRKTAEGPDVVEYRLVRVRVRFNGETAVVDGTGAYTLPDGSRGISRYTDVYQRIRGEWKVSSAQVERVASGAATFAPAVPERQQP